MLWRWKREAGRDLWVERREGILFRPTWLFIDYDMAQAITASWRPLTNASSSLSRTDLTPLHPANSIARGRSLLEQRRCCIGQAIRRPRRGKCDIWGSKTGIPTLPLGPRQGFRPCPWTPDRGSDLAPGSNTGIPTLPMDPRPGFQPQLSYACKRPPSAKRSNSVHTRRYR